MEVFIIICAIMETVFGEAIPSSNISVSRTQCGIDYSPISVVYEGFGKIETYPWLGTLSYPLRDKWLTTSVVLVTKQMAIGPAMDVDKVPKFDFRSRSRVTLGANCSGPALRVKDYSFHPDYAKTTSSAPVLIQLEYDARLRGFRPICEPPAALNNAQFYAVTLSNDCHKSTIKLYRMAYVEFHLCKAYYTQSGLETESVWPSHTICARATSGQECVWRSGTVLALRQNLRWSLVGIGILGPGCRAPARFMDYSIYQPWVRNSLLRIGRPAVTRIADNHIVMRRSFSSVQRFGPCDLEETKLELYTDKTTIEQYPSLKKYRVSYNFTIFANVEYTCVIFRVLNRRVKKMEQPKIFLRRWCTSPSPLCYGMRYLQVDFYLEIFFTESITYQALVYGKELKFLDIKRTLAYFNSKKPLPAIPQLTKPETTTETTP